MKVLLLDDHPLVRSALESVIQALGQDIAVVPVATAAQARACLSDQGPMDLVLLDLQLPDADGFSLMAEWRRAYPNTPVVVISGSEHPADVVRALEEGALGFIPKRTANEVLMQALRMVLSGGVYVPPMALQMALGAVERSSLAGLAQVHEPAALAVHRTPTTTASSLPRAVGADAAIADGTASRGWTVQGRTASPTPGLRLTPRQTEVLELLLKGQPNKLIARQLNLSVETVKDHVASLLRVLGVSSRTQAVLAVSQMMGASGAPSLMGLTRTPSSLAAGRPMV